jgi:hypothetical protein
LGWGLQLSEGAERVEGGEREWGSGSVLGVGA